MAVEPEQSVRPARGKEVNRGEHERAVRRAPLDASGLC